MTMFYSKATGGFYDAAIHGDAIPDDAVEITRKQYLALMEAQAKGQAICADAKGAPIATDRPAASLEQLAAAARLKRDELIDGCRWLIDRHRDEQSAGASTTLTDAQFVAWLAYVQALRDVPQQKGFPAAIDWPVAPT